jgi:hypothetical protein
MSLRTAVVMKAGPVAAPMSLRIVPRPWVLLSFLRLDLL